jgi:preprotein translocase subunit SecG
MYSFILVCHIIIAVAIMVVVLMQSGKGGGLGAGFGGGGANTLFGSSGGGNFFTKLTMCLAAAFMITSISLTAARNRSLRTSIFDQAAPNGPGPGALAPAPAAPGKVDAKDAPPSQPTATTTPAPGAAPLAQPGIENTPAPGTTKAN